jgi:DNA-binding Lrp family transcriptional regulator
MSRRSWHRPRDATQQGRDATLAQVIECVDRAAPETKTELADAVGISEQYLSELLRDLKANDIVRKAYVVDDAAVYANAKSISLLHDGAGQYTEPAETPVEGNDGADVDDRGATVLDLLRHLDEVTTTQYVAASATFDGTDPDPPAGALESLTNERYSAVLSELKDYTLTTDWPGNRVASDLATIATNLEIVGDRACFVEDVVDRRTVPTTGIVEERVQDIFRSGEEINHLLKEILFQGDLAAYEDLVLLEEGVHRDLDELFELITAYDPESYGYLVTVTRALERAIFYWVHSAELAVRLHSAITPDHAMI